MQSAPVHNNNENVAAEAAAPPYEVTVEDVHWLLERCGIAPKQQISSLKQCSSSLFCILFQRIFRTQLPNLEVSPDTFEKKLANIRVVLRELERILGTSLSSISPEEIVLLNEEHIGLLIAVFIDILQALRSAEVDQQAEQQAGEPAAGGKHNNAAGGADEEVSSVESAIKTQKLVDGWKQGIVPPRHKGVVDALELARLQKQITAVDEVVKALTARKKPQAAAAASAAPRRAKPLRIHVDPERIIPPMAAASVLRDMKIERLRNERFLSSVQREVNSAACSHACQAEVALRHTLQRERQKQRADLRDLKKFAIDEDRRTRHAYELLLRAKRCELETEASLMVDDYAAGRKAARVADPRLDHVRRMQGYVNKYAAAARAQMDVEYQRFVRSLCGWRARTCLG